MNDTREVYQGIQDILATMEEVLQHIPTQLDELRLEESFKLLIDFTEGVRSVEEAASKALHSAANSHGNKLKQSLNEALEAYEAGDITRIKETVQNRLLPDFATWKREVEKSIQQ
ncbi:MAG: hypothetical protein ACYDEJ_08070 [Desulfitobacteriaceae bacterium]